MHSTGYTSSDEGTYAGQINTVVALALCYRAIARCNRENAVRVLYICSNFSLSVCRGYCLLRVERRLSLATLVGTFRPYRHPIQPDYSNTSLPARLVSP